MSPAWEIPGPAAHQPQQHREQQQPDQRSVEQDRDAEDDSHLLGRKRAREREGEEHGLGGRRTSVRSDRPIRCPTVRIIERVWSR